MPYKFRINVPLDPSWSEIFLVFYPGPVQFEASNFQSSSARDFKMCLVLPGLRFDIVCWSWSGQVPKVFRKKPYQYSFFFCRGWNCSIRPLKGFFLGEHWIKILFGGSFHRNFQMFACFHLTEHLFQMLLYKNPFQLFVHSSPEQAIILHLKDLRSIIYGPWK